MNFILQTQHFGNQKLKENRCLTAFIVQRSEHFSYNLANTLEGLQIIFCFGILLLYSSQIIPYCSYNIHLTEFKTEVNNWHIQLRR